MPTSLVRGDEVEASWDFSEDTQGWKKITQCELSSRDGALRIKSLGNDPHCHVSVQAKAGWHELTLETRFSGRRNAQIFWTTSKEPNTSEGRSVRFVMRGKGKNWSKNVVYFHTKAPLTSIRLDPAVRVCVVELKSAVLRSKKPPVDEATRADAIRVPPGFKVERLYSVPKLEQGSWVSMALDGRAKDRLITCDQYGSLYRVTIGSSTIKVDKIPVKIGGLQGMIWAFDSLYCVVNGNFAQGPGLYRITDSDADGQLDQVDLLSKLPTTRIGVEHGPHGVVLSPDGQSIYVVAGNMTGLPDGVSQPTPLKNWQEDQLLARLPASNGHATGLLAPGGWVCRVDPSGKKWNLIAAGFRNPYDIAFNADGELFTYDADMEMDIGTPWYRPTRVCHVVQGGEFGWRFGTGKWPDYYTDTVPATVDIGLGSPTGVAFGYGTNFPIKYRDALFISDWTNGTMHAVFLAEDGASYRGTTEPFITGVPLPLTDIVINPHDRAMYFTIGGRRTQSGLYRVTYKGEGKLKKAVASNSAARTTRRKLESLQTAPDLTQLDFIWQHLASTDRALQYAARVALEHIPVQSWMPKAIRDLDTDKLIQASIAGLRSTDGSRNDIVKILKRLEFDRLNSKQKLDYLRAWQLYLLRTKSPQPMTELAGILASQLSDDWSAPVKQEACRLLVRLERPEVISFAMKQMRQAKTQEAGLFYAMLLRVASKGWSLEARRTFLQQLNDFEVAAATGDFAGGGHLQVYIQMFRKDAVKGMSKAHAEQLDTVVNAELAKAFTTGSPTPRKFVRSWTVKDLQQSLSKVDSGRSFENGKAMFRVASCVSCHRFGRTGGIFGPDLTAASRRYSRAVLLREMMEPSKQVSDQYQAHIIRTADGRVVTGRIMNEDKKSLVIATDPLKPAHLVEIASADVEDRRPASVSLMPKGLLNTLTLDEILDLIAYIESGGDPMHRLYQN